MVSARPSLLRISNQKGGCLSAPPFDFSAFSECPWRSGLLRPSGAAANGLLAGEPALLALAERVLCRPADTPADTGRIGSRCHIAAAAVAEGADDFAIGA